MNVVVNNLKYDEHCFHWCCNFADAVFVGCEYGDQVGWCATYVQGPSECSRPEVAQYCCQTCAAIKLRTIAPGKERACPLHCRPLQLRCVALCFRMVYPSRLRRIVRSSVYFHGSRRKVIRRSASNCLISDDPGHRGHHRRSPILSMHKLTFRELGTELWMYLWDIYSRFAIDNEERCTLL